MSYKYIDSIPKPLLNDFVKNRVVPIVGSGFSKNADFPKGVSLPDWRELGELVAKEISGYSFDGNAIDALSYYEELYSRPKLIEFLINVLHHGEITPGETIQAFCNFFSGAICTTNFDTLLEDAMVQSHHPVSVIVTEDRLTVGGNNESRIIKIHGDFNHPDKMVITERDFDMFLEKNPVLSTYIANLFISNTMLLVGYSLDDNDLRGIWQVLHNRLGQMSQPAYCITVGVSEEKRIRYQHRNIMVVNLEGSPKDYKSILRDFFIELKDYCTKMVPSESKIEKVNEQLMIPAENNRLCFISCSGSRIARLSNLLYPVLMGNGITPVRLDDMLEPGDNWLISAESLMQKSRAAIFDVSDGNSNVMLELGTAISNSRTNNDNIIICEDGANIPFNLIGYSYLRYSFEKDVSDEINTKFLESISNWCKETYSLPSATEMEENGTNAIFEDATALFKKGEFSACILSSYTTLEQYTMERIPVRNNSFSTILRSLVVPIIQKEGKYSTTVTETAVDKFIDMRNKTAHAQYSPSKKDAKDFMKLANTIAEALKEGIGDSSES